MDKEFAGLMKHFDHLHSDGIGVFYARKLLCKSEKNINFNWSDNASKFLRFCEANSYSIYFLGSTTETMNKAVENIKQEFPSLEICGWNNGYGDLKKNIVEKINIAKPNILWTGLGTFKQEMWIIENIEMLNCNVVQAVGDIFSLFAKTKKRGPVVVQKMGLEWFVRLFYNPRRYFRRYVVGIPVFIYFVLREKLCQ